METIAEYMPTEHRHQLGTLDVALLLHTLAQRGVDIEALLAGAGLESLDWQNPNGKLTYADKLSIFSAANQNFPHDGLGLWLGEHASLSHFGVLGYALSTSQNVGEAIKSGFKYLRLNGPIFSVKLFLDSEQAVIQIENTLEVGDLLPFCSEYFLSSIVSLFKELTGHELDIHTLALPYARPNYAKLYDERFQCPVIFEQSHCKLRFDASVLSQTLLTHDAATLKRYLASCQSIVETLDSEHLLTNQIKTIFYQTAGSFPTIEQLALEFGCSSRTLRRELVSHNSSYQALLTEVRVELAKELLLGTAMSIDDIGERLGYSDPANFRRAFKSWLNKTPAQFRKGLT
ncbi:MULTISPECIES: AraC family transcriptional regulator [unclassified Vibrio]|uniref:AraC family transcriptional regulator n=1 Tax=unclassified Vibrio TaxID=2614977 RepID=UPI000C815DB7|nr:MULTISPECIES: AraC family transcriptional regulator [unclassified Vibrio]PMI20934.1 AraC family transcriptional regulator [Vibrio sp. 10N.286.46.E10]PMI88078.1 AraC family transcriptional regulator [Vibrio sp. 10N.286.45.E10]PTO95285.1 AraC family transcriptional regulator [Vibrio sp. 10N.286.48.B8]PTP00025.1 AraC family transcriptional regulator [Vibrio sp. 10N.286.45.A3]PTQ22892.1 AraC family transcriptional regulator [Vibrio sp. 10N.286.46.E10]